MKQNKKEQYIEIKSKYQCELCKDIGYIQEDKGKAVHTCWNCLKEGRL